MGKTRRNLGRKTRQRRQRGGDRRLLYLVVVAWVLAIARALGANATDPITSPAVYKNATMFYSTLRDSPRFSTGTALTNATAPAVANTTVFAIPKKALIEKAAIDLANLYEKNDALVIQGIKKIAELSGQGIVIAGTAADDVFGWLSNAAFTLADRLDGEANLLGDAPGLVELIPNAKYTVTGTLPSDIKSNDPIVFLEAFKDEEGADVYKVERANNRDAGTYDLLANDVVLVPLKGGRRKSRRKSLRRK